MDDMLYPLSSDDSLACRKNIEEYMLHHLNIEETEVPKMCLELYKYGTTMEGLKLGYEFDNDKFHEFVHGRLPYEVLKPDPVLRNLLLSMPQRKIYTFYASILNFEHLLFFFDDNARNIASGKEAGLHTVIVGTSTLVAGEDHALRSIHNIKEALPQIWKE
ncbi:hypothetical protein K7X08_008367 [Anisodus acutangulus]|uniref:Uncharacterized protein n=1 Tax=Anisodus acutangulus TaxID=402998 RepID=A0A9Q1RP97_9SOLA|nr:hypothetical protein K7X08_008367 [Anisodus acutangulus]